MTPELISPEQPDLREKSGAGISKCKRAVKKTVKDQKFMSDKGRPPIKHEINGRRTFR
jgi:hypothetical protein